MESRTICRDDRKTLSKFYDVIILEVDAIDNGVSEAENMRWHMKTGLASRVGRLNSPWNAPKSCN